MLGALLGGERDPQKLLALALGSVRGQIPQREVALEGQFTEHHGTRIVGALELVDVLGRQSAALDGQLRDLLREMAPQRAQLGRIPGVSEITARDSIAVIDLDMPRFGSAPRLALLWSSENGQKIKPPGRFSLPQLLHTGRPEAAAPAHP